MRFISDMADGEPSARGRHGRDVGLVPAGKRLKEVVRCYQRPLSQVPFVDGGKEGVVQGADEPQQQHP